MTGTKNSKGLIPTRDCKKANCKECRWYEKNPEGTEYWGFCTYQIQECEKKDSK
jgi:hypothetical protein